MASCAICCQPFTGVLRVQVNCPYCAFGACLKCVEQHLVTTGDAYDPKCMNCANPWSQDFIDDTLPKSFRFGALKKRRTDTLVDKEKALMPATTGLVDLELTARRMRKEIKEMSAERRELEERLRQLSATIRDDQETLREISGVRLDMHALERRTFVRPCPGDRCRGFLSTQWRCDICKVKVCAQCHEIEDAEIEHVCLPENVETAKAINKETRPCPTCGTRIFKIDGCFDGDTPILLWDASIKQARDVHVGDVLVGDDGLPRTVLSTFTGEDEMYRVDQRHGASYTVNSKHTLVLKNDLDRTIEITVEDYVDLERPRNLYGYRSLPGDVCEISLITVSHVGRGTYFGFELDGNHRFVLPDYTVTRNCDQMFCTHCHTAFSWRTGQKETGRVHNPHYYEWIRKTQGSVPREPGDDPCGNQRMPDIWTLRSTLRNRGVLAIPVPLERAHRAIVHVQYVVLPDLRRTDVHPDNKNADLRVKFLLNEMTEEAFRTEVFKRQKRDEKRHAMADATALLTEAGGDLIRKASQCDSIDAVQAVIDELNQLREYYNQIMVRISKRFGSRMAEHVDTQWTVGQITI